LIAITRIIQEALSVNVRCFVGQSLSQQCVFIFAAQQIDETDINGCVRPLLRFFGEITMLIWLFRQLKMAHESALIIMI